MIRTNINIIQMNHVFVHMPHWCHPHQVPGTYTIYSKNDCNDFVLSNAVFSICVDVSFVPFFCTKKSPLLHFFVFASCNYCSPRRASPTVRYCRPWPRTNPTAAQNSAQLNPTQLNPLLTNVNHKANIVGVYDGRGRSDRLLRGAGSLRRRQARGGRLPR